MTKNKIFILIISGIISACCGFTRGGCNEFNGIYTINYKDFEKSELDSVYLLKYRKGTNFTELIDSVSINVDSNSYGRYGFYSDLLINTDSNFVLMASNDYRVFIKDINRNILISNITEDEQSCKSCATARKVNNVGIVSLMQDDVNIELPPRSGFLNQITIER